MDLPRVVGLMSPWSDIRPEHAFGGSGDGVDPTLRVQNLDQTARMYAGSCPTSHPELSPQFGNFQATFPPTLITTGTRDLLQDSCKSLALRMRAAGVAVEIDVWPDLWHVFEYYDEIPEAEISLQRMARFLVREHPALPS
jgi:acetyl esterase/lipase